MRSISRVERRSIEVDGQTLALSSTEERVLRGLLSSQTYSANGTRAPLMVIRTVVVPSDRLGNPRLLLLCADGASMVQRHSFDFCVYTDSLEGQGHEPGLSFGHGDMTQALKALREEFFYVKTGVHQWVCEAALRASATIN